MILRCLDGSVAGTCDPYCEFKPCTGYRDSLKIKTLKEMKKRKGLNNLLEETCEVKEVYPHLTILAIPAKLPKFSVRSSWMSQPQPSL